MTATADRPELASGEALLTRAWQTPPGLLGRLRAVNHKNIGFRFVATAFVFLLIGGVESMLMRFQLARADADVLGPDAYNQAFTMHGTTMMFLFAVPILEGLAMYLVPLQIGARDMPFPRLNAFGYWVYLAGGALLHWSFFTGSIPDGGWFAYTPLTGPEFSPTRALDYWLLGVTFVELSAIVGAIELVVLVLRHRAPGMSLGRMPLFTWSALVMSVMILLAMPAVVTGSVLLELERKLGLPFYDAGGGGNPLLWQHLFWIFGHPEVYIILLPATGIVSAVVATFARRPVVGYMFVVAALVSIGALSFGLWVHHMYTVGLPPLVLAFFGATSALIAIPSGIQVFAWLATLWHGSPRWGVPLLYMAGFVFIFVLGGITGVMVAAPSFDSQVHDSFFVVAHFHYVLIGGAVFPILGGLSYWFPKVLGRHLFETPGVIAFWLLFVGFNVTFFPQHILGLWGMPRRVFTYGSEMGWDGLNTLSTVGAVVLFLGFALFSGNLIASWMRGRPAEPDPWGGDSLEWATASPPPPYNFREMPLVSSRHPLWDAPVGDDDAEPQVRHRAAARALAEPPGSVREQWITSGSEAWFEGVTHLAGPTLRPLVVALGLTVALVGVLVDAEVIAILGVLLGLLALLAWLRPEDAARDVVRTGVRVEYPEVAGRRSSGYWAAVSAVGVLGTLLGYMLYAYFYFSVTVADWPPAGLDAPPLLAPLVPAALIAAACAVALWGGRPDDPTTPPGRLAFSFVGAAVLGALGTARLGAIVSGLELRPREQAYGGMFWTVHVYHGAVTIAGVVMALVVARYLATRGLTRWVTAAVSVVRAWWVYVVIGWVGVSAIYIWPAVT